MTDADRITDLEHRLVIMEEAHALLCNNLMAHVEWLSMRLYKLEGVPPREHYLCNLRVVEGKQLRMEAGA